MFVRFTHSTELKFSTYDISTAFLNTPIKGKTYVCSVPKGFKSNCPGIQSLKLKKYVYGLNAAPLYFHLWLTDLIRKRYVVAKHDNCLYTDFNESLFALLHVDDILLLAKANEEFEQLLRTKFELKIDHHPTQYLGFDFQQNEQKVGLSLHTYIEKMVGTLNQNLATFVQRGSNAPNTTAFKNTKLPTGNAKYLVQEGRSLEEDDNADFTGEVSYEVPSLRADEIMIDELNHPTPTDVKRREMINQQSKSNANLKQKRRLKVKVVAATVPDADYATIMKQKLNYPSEEFNLENYQKVTGIITYIANKGRFDVQVYASMLAQFNGMPTHQTFCQALQILQFLYITRFSSYKFEKITSTLKDTENIVVNVYTDASYTPNYCQGGFYMEVNGTFAGSKSYRLKGTLKSSYDAELFAFREAFNHGARLRASLLSYGFKSVQIRMYCDNLSVIRTVKSITNSGGRVNDRAFTNCIYALRREYLGNKYTVDHIAGDRNPADMFTKPLPMDHVKRLLNGEIIGKSLRLCYTSQEYVNSIAPLQGSEVKNDGKLLEG